MTDKTTNSNTKDHYIRPGPYKSWEGFRLDNDVLAICPNAAATPLLSLDKYNRFTKNC